MPRKEASDENFRQMAVEMALASGNVSATARQLGLPYWKLNGWLRVHFNQKKKQDATERPNQMQAEIAARDKRIKELEVENEILKKAAAYFAKGL